MERLTAERLREVIHYDPVTGIFTWVASGKRAGTAPTKTRLYRRIGIDGGEYLEQVLAVLYMTGRWPADEVDHDNRDKIDNRRVNLREATRGQNQANTPVYRNNA